MKGVDLRDLMQEAVLTGASDLHCSAGLPPVMRIDGLLHFVNRSSVIHDDEFYQQLISCIGPEQAHRLQSFQQVDCATELPGVGRFRLNVFKHSRGWAAAIRVIPAVVPSLEVLQLPPVVTKFAEHDRGLILVTGPTGSGKSSTLAAMLDHINQRQRRHIVTIEDPIEFIHTPARSLVHQREVGAHVASFREALRAALREDPDVLLVGELRDLETTRLALTAAETGHLVLASLHSSSAHTTLDRIIDMFPAEEQGQVRATLSHSIQAILSQSLVPRSCGGRVALVEILVATPAARTLIRDAKNHQLPGLMQTSKAVGMQTTASHLEQLIQQGVIDSENLVHIAESRC
jgi:twitching motility protein PilT